MIERFQTIGDILTIDGLNSLRRFLPSCGRQLLRIIEQHNVDIVHINSRQAYFAAAWAKHFSSRPFRLIATQHLVRKAADNIFWRWAYSKIDSLICVSKLVQQTYAINSHGKALFRHCEVIYNSIIPDPAIMQKPKSDPIVPIIFYHGRICREKGVFKLIEAVKLLENRPFLLRFAGVIANADKDLFMQAIEPLGKQVELIGFSNDIAQLTHEATIGVIPSIVAEAGGPLVLFENMAYRLPTITTNNGSQTEIIRHGESGLLYNPNDIDALASFIEELLNNVKLREQLSACAQQHFLSHYNYQDTLVKYESVYKQI